jgi:hypothetical protein
MTKADGSILSYEINSFPELHNNTIHVSENYVTLMKIQNNTATKRSSLCVSSLKPMSVI